MKKRIILVLLTFAMLCTLMPSAFAATTTPYQVVTVDKTTVQQGETVNVKVTLPNISETAGSFTVNLKFDKTLFEVTKVNKPPKVNCTDNFGDAETVSMVAGNALDSNNSGELTANASYSLNTLQVAGVTVIDATLKAKASGSAVFSFTTFEITKSESGSTVKLVQVSDLETPPSVTIPKAPIASVTASVVQPVKGTPLATSVTVDSAAAYTGAVKWYKGNTATGTPVTGSAVAEQVYTAKITLTAKDGESFANTVTVPAGYTLGEHDNSKVVLTKTFPQTADKNALQGSVSITGTLKFGEKLTANTNSLNYNGESLGTLSYQWIRGGAHISGATNKEYTLTAADVGNSIAVEVKNSNNSGSVVGSTGSNTVAKADGPSAPTGLVGVSKTDSTITVTANSAWEYSKDGGSNWQDSNIFTGLNSNTDYSIVARVKATETHEASAACSAISITTAQATADDTLKNTLKNAVTAYTGVYDGTAHNAFSVGSLPTGWTVQYASSESGSYSNTVPQVTNVSDSKTLWVKFSNSGYSDVVTSYSVSVTARDISGATITLNPAPTYNGVEQAVTIASVKIGSTTLANTDYEIVTGTDKAINVASKTLKITGKGNYKGTAQADWTLAAKDISSVTVTVTGTYTYTGALILPAYTVTDGGATVADTNYTAVITDNTNAGTATITLTGKGNYTGTKTETFIINNAVQTITVPTAEVPVTFGSSLDLSTVCSSNAPGATLTFALKSGSTLPTGTNLSSDGTVTAGTTEGTFVVAVNAAAVTNYDAAAQQEFTVKIVNLPAASVTTAPAAKTGLTYNGAEQVLVTAGSGITGGALQYKLDGGAYSVDLPKAKNAGNYTVHYKVTGDAAHSDSAEQHFTVTIGKKDASVKPKDVTITKGDAIPAFALEYTGLVSGDTLTPGTAPTFTCYETGTTPVSTTTAAGTYTITWANLDAVTFSDTNYNATKTATGTLTISSPASSGSYTPTYGVTVDKTEHGSVAVSHKAASSGATVTVTVTPDKGYVLETLTVLDQNGKELKLTEKDGKYTFPMPASKVTVKATFMEDNTMLNYFVDVKADDYFYDAVLWAVRNGITTGTDATHFSPDAACTRAQIVTFLWRAAGSPEPKSMGSFADVPADSYYAKAVAWAVENGITGGTGDGKFSPDATCTREQAVTFLYRASGSPAVSGGSAFTDVAENAYYASAVAWAQQNGVTGGIGGGRFGSGNDCTRGQIVTFLYRAYQGK